MVRTGRRWSIEEHAMTVHHPHRRFLQPALCCALIAIVGLAQTVAAAGNEPPIARVRSSDRLLALLIARAAGHSATFQRLIASIERSNGIVYVEAGTCSHGVRACLQMWMYTVGPNRFLRVSIDTRKTDSDLVVMGSMGHELQHAVEALSESSVTDGRSLYNFFRRFAPTDGNRFETIAAMHAGDDVLADLGRH
jgi:hypothetical protein